MDADAFSSSAQQARTRASMWGSPGARDELRWIAEDARVRAGFAVSAIEVLREDGLLEEVVFDGSVGYEPDWGRAYPLRRIHPVFERGAHYGRFTFLGEEDMEPALRDAIREYGYVPTPSDSTDPQRWRALDMLLARVVDDSGRTRVLFHLDGPLDGCRPQSSQLLRIAEDLELALQATMAVVEREELTHQARIDGAARAVTRAAFHAGTADELLAMIYPALVDGFHAHSVAVWLHDDARDADDEPAAVAPLARMRPAIEAAARRAWSAGTVIVADTDRVWGDDELDRDHRADLGGHLHRHGAEEVLFIPVGAGHESIAVLIVVREGSDERWAETDSAAALSVGHDLGRALLGARARDREHRLIDELRHLDTYRRQLIATVAHELSTPLGVIVGHVELLEAVPDLPAAALISVKALRRGSARLSTIVEGLLLLSRAHSPTDSVQRLPVDVDAMLADVVEDQNVVAEQHGVELCILPTSGSPAVLGEAEALRGLLVNLVSNAVKYSLPGGLVALRWEADDDGAVFTCADSGIGISAGDRQHLFTEFFRSTNPEALRRPGTGLGLAIAARIVARHDGRIDVESELGDGTTFRVFMPHPDPGNEHG